MFDRGGETLGTIKAAAQRMQRATIAQFRFKAHGKRTPHMEATHPIADTASETAHWSPHGSTLLATTADGATTYPRRLHGGRQNSTARQHSRETRRDKLQGKEAME